MPDNNLQNDIAKLTNSIFDNQYHILEVLGCGGTSVVVLAKPMFSLEQTLAIKMLLPKWQSHPEAADYGKRFEREAMASKQLSHPNVVEIYNVCKTADGTPYILLKYLKGETLEEILQKRKVISPEEIVRMLSPIGSALDAAHKMKIIHRDLKPSNIMYDVSVKGEIVATLLDLGIAKLMPGMGGRTWTKLTQDGIFIGTPLFASPEQWGDIKDGEEIDHRTDIYSLGLIIYCAVSGIHPFDGFNGIADLCGKHLNEVPKPLHELTKGINARFSNAVARSISKNRDERQSTCEELFAELSLACEEQKQRRESNECIDLEGRFSIEQVFDDNDPVNVCSVFDSHRKIVFEAKVFSKRLSERVNLSKLNRFMQVKHRDLISLVEFGKGKEGKFFLVYENREGVSLDELIEKKKRLFILKEAIFYIRQVAELVNLFHKKGLHHNYVIPDFIFVDGVESGFGALKLLHRVVLWDIPTNQIDPDFMDNEVEHFAYTKNRVSMSTMEIPAATKIMYSPDTNKQGSKTKDIYSIVMVLIKMLMGDKINFKDKKEEVIEVFLRANPSLPNKLKQIVEKGVRGTYEDASKLLTDLNELWMDISSDTNTQPPVLNVAPNPTPSTTPSPAPNLTPNPIGSNPMGSANTNLQNQGSESVSVWQNYITNLGNGRGGYQNLLFGFVVVLMLAFSSYKYFASERTNTETAVPTNTNVGMITETKANVGTNTKTETPVNKVSPPKPTEELTTEPETTCSSQEEVALNEAFEKGRKLAKKQKLFGWNEADKYRDKIGSICSESQLSKELKERLEDEILQQCLKMAEQAKNSNDLPTACMMYDRYQSIRDNDLIKHKISEVCNKKVSLSKR